MSELRIPYKPNKVIFILATSLFGVCAGIMGKVAATNDRGLILNGLLEFSPQGATIFYWVITAAALGFVVAGTLALVNSMFSNREIVVTNDSITSPKNGLSKQNVTVNFSDITGINMRTIQKTKILSIEHVGGKLSIPNSMLPSKASFEDLVSQLEARANN